MNSDNNYIDVHTHSLKQSDAIQVYNQAIEDPFQASLCSVGIHPWYINRDNLNNQLEQLEILLHQKTVIALGECGLDKLIDLPMVTQETVFKAQILLAEKHKKPLIIHCVRAFDDLLRIRKGMNVSVPMIIHGYNNNKEIALQLLKSGCYFSFGKALLNNESNASKVISLIPSDKLFLETDSSDTTIENIYTAASGLLKLEMDVLKKIISTNFKNVFLHS
ncbi:MAG: TatD family hydrolase [Bacteroidetes bacterium]|nr:TatD family hydrolase [Bacteroidota bacterium]